jgi:hypothetical protein
MYDPEQTVACTSLVRPRSLLPFTQCPQAFNFGGFPRWQVTGEHCQSCQEKAPRRAEDVDFLGTGNASELRHEVIVSHARTVTIPRTA